MSLFDDVYKAFHYDEIYDIFTFDVLTVLYDYIDEIKSKKCNIRCADELLEKVYNESNYKFDYDVFKDTEYYDELVKTVYLRANWLLGKNK